MFKFFSTKKHEDFSRLEPGELKVKKGELGNGDIVDHVNYGIGVIMSEGDGKKFLVQFGAGLREVLPEDVVKSKLNNLPTLK